MNLFNETKQTDIINLEKLIRQEGVINSIINIKKDFLDIYLEKQDIKEIYKFKDLKYNKWNFINNNIKSIVFNIDKIIKQEKTIKLLKKADFMILRKKVYEIITENKDIKSDILYSIIKDFTYEEVIRELGFKIIIEDEKTIFKDL